jgi:lysyl-tRNA synthetase class 1
VASTSGTSTTSSGATYQGVLTGRKARHVHTSDDRDPLRKIPERMPDREGRWHVLTEAELKNLNRYVGIPYVHVPDPFGCCKSWAEHFNNVWIDGVKMLGVELEDYSNDRLYSEGKFIPPMRTIHLTSRWRKRSFPVPDEHADDYILFNPI